MHTFLIKGLLIALTSIDTCLAIPSEIDFAFQKSESRNENAIASKSSIEVNFNPAASNNKLVNSNFFTIKAKQLLEWNKTKLTSQSDLDIRDLPELFAPEFVVITNGKKYEANYQNYYGFLNKFRSSIETIDYCVSDYLNSGTTVTMPLEATVKHLQGQVDVFDAILIVKFNELGKIVLWQEVYSMRQQ